MAPTVRPREVSGRATDEEKSSSRAESHQSSSAGPAYRPNTSTLRLPAPAPPGAPGPAPPAARRVRVRAAPRGAAVRGDRLAGGAVAHPGPHLAQVPGVRSGPVVR